MAGEVKTPTLRLNLLGSYLSVWPRAEVHASLLSFARAKVPGYVCVSNVHTTMMGVFDASYREITNQSLFSVPDGLPLVWAMRSLGAGEQDRVRGPSLMRDLCDQGRASGMKHYLYGGSPTTLVALKERLEKDYPGVVIVGAESPPFRPLHAITAEEFQEIANRINASGADFLWVGLGAPKQEQWIWQQRNRVRPIMMAVGAAFDLIPGIVPEAPELLQKLGLEWLYRFVQEPRRLWRRYLFNNPMFLLGWCAQLLSAKLLARDYRRRGNGSVS